MLSIYQATRPDTDRMIYDVYDKFVVVAEDIEEARLLMFGYALIIDYELRQELGRPPAIEEIKEAVPRYFEKNKSLRYMEDYEFRLVGHAVEEVGKGVLAAEFHAG